MELGTPHPPQAQWGISPQPSGPKDNYPDAVPSSYSMTDRSQQLVPLGRTEANSGGVLGRWGGFLSGASGVLPPGNRKARHAPFRCLAESRPSGRNGRERERERDGERKPRHSAAQCAVPFFFSFFLGKGST